MNILYLGPQCDTIQRALVGTGHNIWRTEEPFSAEFFRKGNFDFAVSYRYRRIITKDVINECKSRLVNLHISFLPWNKGSDPNLWSWLENTPKGVTIHQIDEGLDTGAILLQEHVVFDTEKETLRTSYEKLSHAIETLFINNMTSLFTDSIRPRPQQGKGSFHFSKDKEKYNYLYQKLGWDTPVHTLIGKAELKS